MIQSVHVIGQGRAGRPIAARLRERGVSVTVGRSPQEAHLVLFCVPDTAIAAVAQSVPVGPWIAHVSGATPLRALDPHRRRFSLHPLQTFASGGGPEQLDGVWAARTVETDEARSAATDLAELLGVTPFSLADDDRALYHAAAVIASNFLVTLYRSAASLFEQVGAPPQGLVPLMRHTIEDGFELTGPIARGDWSTVDAHIAALHERAPELESLYRTLADATRQ